MAKQLRMRISRVLPSFHSCRRTDDEPAAAQRRAPAFCLSPVNPKVFDDDFPPPPRSSPVRTRARGPDVVPLTGCGCRPAAAYDADAEDLPVARGTPAYQWRREARWHVVARADDSPRLKIDSDGGGGVFPRPAAAPLAELRRTRRRRGRARQCRGRASTSSADSGWFSSEDEENDEWDANDDDDEEEEDETATLVSSHRSLSTDSSFLPGKPARRTRGRRPERAPAAEGKVAESFAVVKQSEDPRTDFRRSMAEMVMEKEIYEGKELEQMLRCFLSLNSRHHHDAIVAAFSDVWDALFHK